MVLQWTLLNSFVALMGYYFAAFTIDLKWMGRFRMQSKTGIACDGDSVSRTGGRSVGR